MNKSEKKGPSYLFVFIMGMLTVILARIVAAMCVHWPDFKKAILSMWN